MKNNHTPHWHRGLHALHFGFLGGLVAITFLGTMFISVFSPVWTKQANAAVTRFASGSFWGTPIPSYTDLHPSSTTLVNNIMSQVSTYGTSIMKDNGASTVYEVDAGTPTLTVIPYDCGNGIPGGLASQWSAVPIPFYAVPGGSSSAQMVVYQPSTGLAWEFGHMRNVSGQWQACTGGRISTAGSGVFASPYGVTTSGLAVLGGQLNTQELTAGTINHVIGLNLPRTNGISWPATQGTGNSAGAPAMGQRLRLDPGVNIDSLGLNATAKAIARAAQTYGMIVWNSDASVGFTAENPTSATSHGLPDPYNGLSLSLSGFPWDKLQALPDNYGQANGTPTITKFSASSTSVTADSRVTLSWQANNVTRCAIGGLADNLAASGSMQTGVLQNDSTFMLRCGGPLGIATSQVTIKVSPIGPNELRRELGPGSIIDQPYEGYANIFPEFMNGADAEGVYKVVYYQNKTYISETATPPFALNTLRLPNGPYTVSAKIYYRDGHTTERTLGISVNNGTETIASIVQTRAIQVPSTIPLGWGILGGLTALTMMGAGTWWGWHRAHLF
jgi:hypothetical protein